MRSRLLPRASARLTPVPENLLAALHAASVSFVEAVDACSRLFDSGEAPAAQPTSTAIYVINPASRTLPDR